MLWSSQTQSARMAVIYITVGALIDVWTALYYFLKYEKNPDGSHDNSLFWIAGFFFSGLALLIIGVLVGRIGRAAGQAEVAPSTAAPLPVQAPPAPGAVAAGATDLRLPAPGIPPQGAPQPH